MKRLLLISLASAFVLSIPKTRFSGSSQLPAYDTGDNFKQGEVLLPDYVHTDTLVVTDAIALNNLIQSADTDSDIAGALSCTTVDIQTAKQDSLYIIVNQ